MKRSPLKRSTAPIKLRRSKPRRGRLRDRKYLAFVASQPCMISGERPVTVHHLRTCGSPKDDRRTVPLAARFHLHDLGPTSVERLGRRGFQEFHGVNVELEIARLNAKYEGGL